MEIEDANVLEYTKNPVTPPPPKVYNFGDEDNIIEYLLDKVFESNKTKVYVSCSSRQEDGTFIMRAISANARETYKVSFNHETQTIEKEIYEPTNNGPVETPNEQGSRPSDSEIHKESAEHT